MERNNFLDRNKAFSGLTITLPNEVVIKNVPAYQIKIGKIEVRRLIDDSENKRVTAITKNLGEIILWEGESYDEIGQWTDTDVTERLISIYNA